MIVGYQPASLLRPGEVVGQKRVIGNTSHNLLLYIQTTYQTTGLQNLLTNSSIIPVNWPPFHTSIARHVHLPPWRQLKAPSPSARKSREYELSWIEKSHVLIYIQSALITYVTAGYPTPEETPDIMLAMEAGGAGTMPQLNNAARRYSYTLFQT